MPHAREDRRQHRHLRSLGWLPILTKQQREALLEAQECGGPIAETIIRRPGNSRHYPLERLHDMGFLAFVGFDLSGARIYKLTPEGWTMARRLG